MSRLCGMQDDVQKKISTNFNIFTNGLANILQSRLIISFTFNYNLVHDLSYIPTKVPALIFLYIAILIKKIWSQSLVWLEIYKKLSRVKHMSIKSKSLRKNKNFSIAESEYLWIWGHLSSHTLKSKLRSLIGRSTNLTLNSLGCGTLGVLDKIFTYCTWVHAKN